MDTPRPSPRTNRTRRVPHPVLIGHAAPPPRVDPTQRPGVAACAARSTAARAAAHPPLTDLPCIPCANSETQQLHNPYSSLIAFSFIAQVFLEELDEKGDLVFGAKSQITPADTGRGTSLVQYTSERVVSSRMSITYCKVRFPSQPVLLSLLQQHASVFCSCDGCPSTLLRPLPPPLPLVQSGHVSSIPPY